MRKDTLLIAVVCPFLVGLKFNIRRIALNIFKFDNDLKSYADKAKYIEDTFDVNKLNKVVTNKVKGGENISDTSFGNFLDDVANYLLESKDIDSGRKIEDTFYRNEKHYKSSYAMGKNTAVDTDLTEWKMNEQTIEDSVLDDYSSVNGYLNRLFNTDNLDRMEIRKLIMNISKLEKVTSKELLSAFEWFEDVLKDSLSEKDLDFVSLFKKYDKIADISKELNVSSQAVSNKLTRVCDKIKKNLQEK